MVSRVLPGGLVCMAKLDSIHRPARSCLQGSTRKKREAEEKEKEEDISCQSSVCLASGCDELQEGEATPNPPTGQQNRASLALPSSTASLPEDLVQLMPIPDGAAMHQTIHCDSTLPHFQGRLLGNCFFEGSIAPAPFDQNQGSYCRTAAEYAAAAKVDLCCQLRPGISSKRAGPEANQLQECDGLGKVESAGILYGVDMAVQSNRICTASCEALEVRVVGLGIDAEG